MSVEPQHAPVGADQAATIERVQRLADAGPGEIAAAIGELEREWSVERTLELNAAVNGALGLALALLTFKPGWVLYAIAVLLMLAWHSLHGSHPAIPLLRRLGTRTEAEIRDELLALRLLRGDFAFATPLLEGGARAKLAERLAANKRRAGSFLGGGAGTSAFAGAAAAAKEE